MAAVRRRRPDLACWDPNANHEAVFLLKRSRKRCGLYLFAIENCGCLIRRTWYNIVIAHTYKTPPRAELDLLEYLVILAVLVQRTVSAILR